MSFLRLLHPQGIAGIAVSLALAISLVLQKGETRHWKSESARFELLYRDEQSAFATTVANYRAGAEAARAADLAAAERVAAQQQAINQRSQNDLEARLANARARAEQLRQQTSIAAADSRSSAGAPVPGLSAAPVGAAQAPHKDRLPASDALTATEQAIQLDELIKWVKAQAAVDMNAPPVASPYNDSR
ncbi:MAG TPA: hypothetical protein VGE84_03700 [Allosphingosinicella sp.]